MSPARVNRPVLPLTFLQRAAQSIPIVRKLFWTPRTCYADIHDLADASAGEIAVRDLAGAHVEHCFVAHLNPGKLVGDCLLVASRTDGVAASFRHYMERHNPGSIGFCGGVDTGVKFFFRGPPRSWRPLRGLIIIIGSSKVCLVFG
jgi:hypothetical protein